VTALEVKIHAAAEFALNKCGIKASCTHRSKVGCIAAAIRAAVAEERERWQRALAGGGSIYLGQEPEAVHRIFGVAVEDSKEIGAAQEREACAEIAAEREAAMLSTHATRPGPSDFGARASMACWIKNHIRARSRAKGEG